MMAEPFGDQSVRHAAWIIRQADELLSRRRFAHARSHSIASRLARRRRIPVEARPWRHRAEVVLSEAELGNPAAPSAWSVVQIYAAAALIRSCDCSHQRSLQCRELGDSTEQEREGHPMTQQPFEHVSFDKPDEVREGNNWRLDLVNLAAGAQIGRLTIQPGFRWTEHVRAGGRH